MVWGNQQPEWMETLPPAEQREEIEEWFAAVAQRYPDLDYVEVVNEPLNDPPNKDDEGGGNYIAALGGEGASGWEWILQSYRLARQYFPRARLLINDYNITNKPENTRRYRGIIELLQKENLVDGIGVQAHSFATTSEWPMEVHRANLDSLAQTGLPIYVTEMDIDGPTDAEQLASYQRVFPVFWEHPAVKGITLWGYRPGMWRTKEGAYLVRDRRQRASRPGMAATIYQRRCGGRYGAMTRILPLARMHSTEVTAMTTHAMHWSLTKTGCFRPIRQPVRSRAGFIRRSPTCRSSARTATPTRPGSPAMPHSPTRPSCCWSRTITCSACSIARAFRWMHWAFPAATVRAPHVDPRAAWRLFAANFHLFRGTPSSMWLNHVFHEVFGLARASVGGQLPTSITTTSPKHCSGRNSPRARCSNASTSKS